MRECKIVGTLRPNALFFTMWNILKLSILTNPALHLLFQTKDFCVKPKKSSNVQLKDQIGQILTLYLIKSYHQNYLVTSIINSKVKVCFFSNQNLFSIYIKYKHKFKTGTN